MAAVAYQISVNQFNSVIVESPDPTYPVNQFNSINVESPDPTYPVNQFNSVIVESRDPTNPVNQFNSIIVESPHPNNPVNQFNSPDPTYPVNQFNSIIVESPDPTYTLKQFNSIILESPDPTYSVNKLNSIILESPDPNNSVNQFNSIIVETRDPTYPVNQFNSIIVESPDPNNPVNQFNTIILESPDPNNPVNQFNSIIVESPNPNNPVNQFHFVFLLRLRDVDKISTLSELIISQHGKLEKADKEFIQSILEGKTNHKVLLLLDGYDEYTPGSNQHIDRAIQHSIGNCFLILTSRPGSESEGRTYIYVSKAIRDKMDGEVIIEGFNYKNIVKCSTQYLDSEEKSEAMLRQAKGTRIYDLLQVPIILLMICVVFSEYDSLPRTRTEIYDRVFEMVIDRTMMKTFPDMYADVKEWLEPLLYALGEFSWKALQEDVRQLLLKKVMASNKSKLQLNGIINQF